MPEDVDDLVQFHQCKMLRQQQTNDRKCHKTDPAHTVNTV